MLDAHVNNPKSPKFYVKRFLESRKDAIKGRLAIDIPAGNGATSEILLALGANVEAFDLFPEYFMLESIECKQADVMKEIPVADQHADWVICQEGIEHFSDQLKVFKEFNRILKKNGKLLITTPSYSNLAAKFSYLLFESESTKQMPPNEIDDIWMSDKNVNPDIYHGHIFLVGLQRLRTLAKLAGFKIESVEYVRVSKGSLALFPLFYPFILVSSLLRYFRNLKRNQGVPLAWKKNVYGEQLKINISLKNLLNRHTFVSFRKEQELSDVNFRAENVVKPFGKIM